MYILRVCTCVCVCMFDRERQFKYYKFTCLVAFQTFHSDRFWSCVYTVCTYVIEYTCMYVQHVYIHVCTHRGIVVQKVQHHTTVRFTLYPIQCPTMTHTHTHTHTDILSVKLYSTTPQYSSHSTLYSTDYTHTHSHTHTHTHLEVVVTEEECSEVCQFPQLRTQVLDGSSDLQFCPLVPLLLLHYLLTPHCHCPCNHTI